MRQPQRKRLFLLGLDERLLWQLTRTLATLEDEIEYVCRRTVTEAGELLRQGDFNLLVVDGADEGIRVAESLAGEASSRPPPRMLVLTEESFQSLPQEMLLPDDTLFLEKPFNPKEFPFFVVKALETYAASSPLPSEASEIRASAELLPSEPLPPQPSPVEVEVLGAEASTEEDFYHYFSEGFACLARRDLEAAKANWLRAEALRPGDRKVLANLARIEKVLAGNQGSLRSRAGEVLDNLATL